MGGWFLMQKGYLCNMILKKILLACAMTTTLAGCMKWDYPGAGNPVEDAAPEGLFVVCQGNFQYGNASLSFYDPDDGTVENEVFARANGARLGDVAQSMTIADGRGWVVVNNSHVVFAIDTDTYRELGRITGLTAPRYMYVVSPDKAYITQLYDNRIFVVNPSTYSITGYIDVPGMEPGDGSTERIVADARNQRYVYVNCYSYWNLVLKIDTETDRVIDTLEVGIQPIAMTTDRYGRLWVLTDGGYPGSPYAYTNPTLVCVDTATFTVVRTFTFPLGTTASDLTCNGNGSTLYFTADAVWAMDVDAETLPAEPLVPYDGTHYQAITVDPVSGEVYLADALDYQQPGIVYRYSPEGEQVGSFRTGVIPGGFCWKEGGHR